MTSRILFLASVMLATITSVSARPEGKCRDLVSLLSDVRKECELVPDSFFGGARRLSAEIAVQTDPTAKAVYSATLAHMLAQNSWRAQSRDRGTVSPLDSIEEWSSKEYATHAAALYRSALADLDLLHAAPTREWLPLVKRGRDEEVYGGGMLHVVWRAATSDFSAYDLRGNGLSMYGRIIRFYNGHSMREAALRTAVDSVETLDWNAREAALRAVAKEYSGVPACDIVYPLIAQTIQDKKARVELLREGLRLYPRSAAVSNALAAALCPELTYSVPQLCYPGKAYDIVLSVANMKAVTQTVYRLPDDFTPKASDASLLQQVRRAGRKVSSVRRTLAQHPAEEQWKDTLRWQAPDLGVYAMVVEGQPGAEVAKPFTPEAHVFYVSRLKHVSHSLPGDRTQMIVVDAESGAPQEGVTVSLSARQRNGEFTPCGELVTDSRGMAIYNNGNEHRALRVKLSKGEDRAWRNTDIADYVHHSYYDGGQARQESRLHVYTDRSVYRPGQTVYVGAVSFRKQGDEAKVCAGEEQTLTMRNPENKVTAERRLRTDDFGVMSDSVVLPRDAKPGMYYIRVGSGGASVRVEEYRRPTFAVRMDEAPAVSLPADSLTLTGKAVTYSGLPVAKARVTGRATFSRNLWLRDAAMSSARLDTVTTDASGCFSIRVPLTEAKSLIDDMGTRVTVRVDVLDGRGETQQGEMSVPLSPRPFILTCSVSAVQDKERLQPWKFDVYASTGRRVDGNVVCRVMRGGEERDTFTMPSGKASVPEMLSSLPSGRYSLKAKYIHGTDTASCQSEFEIFSMADTKLAGTKELRIYTPCDTFATNRPARIQIGTTLRGAWIYCTAISRDRVVTDTLMCVNDTAFVWQIPYREEYGDGLLVNACVTRDGVMHESSVSLRREVPDDRLRMKWESFRNMSRPGAGEEWKLSLTMPDGSPARANVLLSMYDASLDAISPHAIRLFNNYYRFVPFSRYISGSHFDQSLWHWSLLMSPKLKKEPSYVFSTYNQDYFVSTSPQANIFGGRRGGRATMRLTGSIGSLDYVQDSNVKMAAPMMKSMAMADKEAVETVEELAVAEDSGSGDMEQVRGVRNNAFGELAFFKPTLRTGADGMVVISFTMPESLTSWHLTGVAHTKDMKTVQLDESITVTKDLMAELNLPRYLRNGDKASFTASIRNISGKKQSGTAVCTIMDAATEKVLLRREMKFGLDESCDTTYTLLYNADLAHPELLIRWTAKSREFTDGEQRNLVVLSDMERVTETRAFSLTKPGTTTINLSSLYAGNHPDAVNRGIAVEYTTRPMWLALQSLPALYTPRTDDVLSLTAAYYSTTLAQHVISAVPGAEGLADSLEYKPMLALDNRMSLLSRISSMQRSDGSFAWFPGMSGNDYITREVAVQLARLVHMGISSDAATESASRILAKAVSYLAASTHRQVERMKKDRQTNSVSAPDLRYLYILSRSGITPDKQMRQDVDYLVGLLSDAAVTIQSPGDIATAALILKAYGKDKAAKDRMSLVMEKYVAQKDGYYVSYPGGSRVSSDRKLQAHVQIMEAVGEVNPDAEAVSAGMTEWLLQQKRTQQWDNPVCTVNAVYALVNSPSPQPLADNATDILKLKQKKSPITHRITTPSTSLGYVRDSIAADIPVSLSVQKRTAGISLGAVYASYDIPMDSVRSGWQGFSIRRDIAASPVKVGDRIHVRYTVTADKDYDFVCLQLPRPAAAEPESQLSGYRWQGGLGYYTTVRDSGSEYYIDSMPKGTYVIEEDWIVSRSGSYVTGPAVVKCVYAPEFQSHTNGTRLNIE